MDNINVGVIADGLNDAEPADNNNVGFSSPYMSSLVVLMMQNRRTIIM